MADPTLVLLLEQAERERDAARLALHQAEQRAAQARHAQQDLGSYQAQHDARWLAQFQREGTGMPLVQTAAQFGRRLADAIDQQSQQLIHCEQRVLQARQQLQERELRVASVRKLIERRAAERQQRQNRADQKATDELGAQRHRNR
jgi:flagellar FliJ protein